MEKELQPDLLDFNIYARVDLRSHQTQRIDMAEAPAHIRTYARTHPHTRRSATSRLQLKWTRLRRRC